MRGLVYLFSKKLKFFSNVQASPPPGGSADGDSPSAPRSRLRVAEVHDLVSDDDLGGAGERQQRGDSATARRRSSSSLSSSSSSSSSSEEIRHGARASGKSRSSSGAALSGAVATKKPLPSFIKRSSADAAAAASQNVRTRWSRAVTL